MKDNSSKHALELNNIIKNTSIYSMLSERGKEIYFPKEGIPAQSAEASKSELNATAGISTEDDGTPTNLASISKNILLKPKDSFPYAPTYGKSELRELWKKHIYEVNTSLKANISLPVVTAGITHSLWLAGYLFVNKDDKIITPDLIWENYKLIFEQNFLGKLDTINTFKNENFDLDSLEKKLNSGSNGKKVLLLNFPNNPTGYTPTEAESDEIANIIIKYA